MLIRAIIVLYNSDINSSLTLKSLQKIDHHLKRNISIDIYDNSPECSNINYRKYFSDYNSVNYVSDIQNSGLSSAYNFALNRCNKFNEKWLLLLDQDTEVTNQYLKNINEFIQLKYLRGEIVAIIPDIINERGKKLVPVKVSRIIGRYSYFNQNETMIDDEVRTINSCSLLKVDFLNRINGFNNNFKLDCLDHWIYHTIYTENKLVYLTHDKIVHNLSINNTATYVSEERYRNILGSERLFYSHYTGKIQYLFYKLRLCKRALKQALKVKNKKICKMTLKSIFSANNTRL